MHKKVKFLPWAYDEHLRHHRAFPSGRFNEEPKKDKYINLTLCIEHILTFSLPLAAVAAFFDPVLSWMALGYGVFHYYLFKKVHIAMHMRHKAPKWMEYYYWTHFMHHQYPNRYFCVVLPGFDFIAGTACKMTERDRRCWEKAKDNQFFLPSTEEDRQEDIRQEAFINRCTFTKNTVNGYVPPAPTGRARSTGELLLNLIIKTQVGKVERLGDWNLINMYTGSYIFASSHGSWKDPFILMHCFKPIRVLTHKGVMSELWGLVGYIFGNALGCISCAPGDNGAAVRGAVEVLKSNQDLGICPEGWAWMDGELRPFKTGAARIAKESNCPIVPIYIEYKHYLPKWCLRLPPWAQYLITFFPPWAGSGATVKIGTPIVNLTKDVKTLTLELEEVVRSLKTTNETYFR